MSKPSKHKIEIADRIVERLGFRDHYGIVTDLCRLSIGSLDWIDEGIELYKNKPTGLDALINSQYPLDINEEAKRLQEKYKDKPHMKIQAIKELRERCSVGLKEAYEAITKVWIY